MEDSFFSKMQRREAGWMAVFPEPGLTPALGLIPIVVPPAKAKVWVELGWGLSVPAFLTHGHPSRSQNCYFLVPLSGLQTRSSWII